MSSNPLRKQAAKDAFTIVALRHCHYCGAELRHDTFTLDHIVPRAVSRTNVRRNFVPACAFCNNKKGNGRSRCVCRYCAAAWAEFGAGLERAVMEKMSFRLVGRDELAALDRWSDVSDVKKFRKVKGGVLMVERVDMAGLDIEGQLLELGDLMDREVVVTRGEETFKGKLMGIMVGFLHSSGPMVSVSIDGFVRGSITLRPGDRVVLGE